MITYNKKIRRFGFEITSKIYAWFLRKRGYKTDIVFAKEKRKKNAWKIYNSYYVYFY